MYLIRRCLLTPATAALLLIGACDRDTPVPVEVPTPPPTNTTTSGPISGASTGTFLPPTNLPELYHALDAAFATTRPHDVPLAITDAARVLVEAPIYLCPRGDIWATHPAAPPTAEVLRDATKSQVHLLREPARFIAWGLDGPAAAPTAIIHDARREVLVSVGARVPIEIDGIADWSRAFIHAGRIIVPTDSGIAVLRREGTSIQTQTIALASPAPGTSCHVLRDLKGLIAWSSSNDPAVISHVARFVDGQWTLLTPGPKWPTSVVQLAPMLDGTVLCVRRERDGSLQLGYVELDAAAVDEATVLQCVEALASPSPAERRNAARRLSDMGRGAWPILARVAEGQRDDVRRRIRAIIGDQTQPTLDGLRPLPGAGGVAQRLRDGVILRFDAGASVLEDTGSSRTVTPAYVVLRPGMGAVLLPAPLAAALRQDAAARVVEQNNEWIVEGSAGGPARWMGNHLEPMLSATEQQRVDRFVGVDRAGRWLFRSSDPAGATLLIDVTIPDPTPRLPVWNIEAGPESAGWDDEDWPCRRAAGVWSLKELGWSAMTESRAREIFRTRPQDAPPSNLPPGVRLIARDGTRFEDGRKRVQIIRGDGTRIDWPLPPELHGEGAIDGEAYLFESGTGLWLFNAPGRAIRLRRTDDAAAPLRVEGVFTRGLPTEDIRRIWQDRAGRIIVASAGKRLAICFPQGTIPQPIQNLMSAKSLAEAMKRESEK